VLLKIETVSHCNINTFSIDRVRITVSHRDIRKEIAFAIPEIAKRNGQAFTRLAASDHRKTQEVSQ